MKKNIFLILETFFSVKLPLGEIFQIVYTGSLSIIQIASFVAQSKGLIEYKMYSINHKTMNQYNKCVLPF